MNYRYSAEYASEPALEVYETSSGGVAGGVVSGGEEGVAEVGVEAEDEEPITPSESTV